MTDRSHDMTELLDGAYAAFEAMLAVIRRHDHPDGLLFVPMVMAGAAAGNGRDCLLFAPSLRTGRGAVHADGSVLDDLAAAVWLAVVSQVLDEVLTWAAPSARLPGDRAACLGAAQCAREIATLMRGAPP